MIVLRLLILWAKGGADIKRGNKLLLIFTLFYLYFTMALFESSRGNFIPFFIDEFKINNSAISMILSLNTMGCIAGSFFGGHFCEKYGHKAMYIIGSAISTAAVLIAPFTSNLFMLGLFFLLFGIGRSLLSIAVDSMVPVLSLGFESILMNVTHFMYGLGSFAGQRAYGQLLSAGMPWRTIYMYLGIFFIASIILSTTIKTPDVRVKSAGAFEHKELYRNPLIYMFVIALTFVLVTETIINTWFISYMRGSYGLSPAEASKYASVFFLTFALGRLLGGFIVNKIGDSRGMKLFLCMAALCLVIGLQLKQDGLMLMASSGLFVSIMFPTMMVIINSAFKQNASMAIGLVVTISNILFVIIFALMGALNDLLGTYTAFYAAPVSIICCLTALIFVTRKMKISI